MKRSVLALLGALLAFAPPAAASDFSEPWQRADRALVVDAYEYNPIDWEALSSDKRIVGFINKASDGLPPPYYCSGEETERKLCKALWKRHAVTRELFQTRRMVARALGLKWGAYHLARPGNPVEQADNFIDFAEPGPDDLLALDIEDNDPEKWMSLEDAEEFVRQVHRRLGRFPILYTNGTTAKHIADNRYRYRLLSRLPLWYARYKPDIEGHFPKGNWKGYALWQFSAQANCGRKRCPYRPAGTPLDIDVNVAPMDAAELRAHWPFGGLIDMPDDYFPSVPIPVARAEALKGNFRIAYADVATPPSWDEMLAAFGGHWKHYRANLDWAAFGKPSPYQYGMAEYVISKREKREALVARASPEIDPVATGSIARPGPETHAEGNRKAVASKAVASKARAAKAKTSHTKGRKAEARKSRSHKEGGRRKRR